MHLWRWVWTLMFCVVVVSALGLVKFNQIKAAIAFGESFPEPSETVQMIVTQPSEWQSTLTVMGEVVATRSLNVRNELAGTITAIGFESARQVKKGDLLLQLDIENELAQLAALKAQVNIAQLDVNRFAELLKSKASSRDQVDRATAQLAVAKANVRAMQSTIDKKTLIAPFDGIAGLHQLEVGAYLSANTLVTRLVSSRNERWVDFLVPQEYANLQQGALIQLKSTELQGDNHPASVIAQSQEIDTDSRNLRVRALWKNVPDHIKPGSLLEVNLPSADIISVIRLPNVAIRYDAFGAYVFVLTNTGGEWRAKRQPVDIQGHDDYSVVVKSGLHIGETVATIGSAKLREGILVNLAKDQGSAVDE